MDAADETLARWLSKIMTWCMMARSGDVLPDHTLIWHPDGVGFLVPCGGFESIYDDRYFRNYEERAATDIGRQLNAFRVDFVDQHLGDEELIDVGIGDGAFITARCLNGDGGVQWDGRTFGYDINPRGTSWLVDRGIFRDPIEHPSCSLSYWDALEHIPDPWTYLMGLMRPWVFVSLPVFQGVDDVVRSKHYKPDEHLWYFTDGGIRSFMSAFGYSVRSTSLEESRIGRENITTYAFSRG